MQSRRGELPLERFNRILDRSLEIFAGLNIATLVVLTFVQVVGRYVFGRSWGWIEEVCIVLLSYTAWVTACLLLRQGRHLMVTVVVSRLTPSLQYWLRLIMAAVVVIFLLFIVYASKGTIEAMEGIRFISFDLPINIKFFSVPIGATLLAYYQIRTVWTEISEKRHGSN
jgi:TRAP-type C4-dicarboxylate transport system permease small subunit